MDALCEAFALDEMDLAEFERRVDAAHRAASTEELDRLLAGLPSAGVPARAGPAAVAPRRTPGPTTVPPERLRERDVVIGILGGGHRRGRWHPARKTLAVGVMGGATLDFREAVLGSGVTEIHAFAFWGGIELILPPGVRVECSGVGIMGGFDEDHGEPQPDDPAAPVVRLTGLAIMGGVSVEVREPGESSRDARRRRKRLRRLQREARGRFGRGHES
ncbi:MAG: DUF1707 domain-containing protein [Gemmatimonadetes bacterium]|nr:DUF1707 domain-containing protein [Gemmatimonadota bacterium]